MPLIKCKYCHKQISDTATLCPHCNHIISKQQSDIPNIIVNILGICMLIFGIAILVIILIDKKQ